ncbi:hypothetical protein [Mangrovicoccus ximenensis]|uniref:hypothetical protein n=1 Tax=Mangrovicoccus ximenensis TaxID=1911570 RepID=UPI001374B570|nr:hypothetical protein [Mangrovicoccus ximenensis]
MFILVGLVLTPLGAASFDSQAAAGRIGRAFGVDSPDAFGSFGLSFVFRNLESRVNVI